MKFSTILLGSLAAFTVSAANVKAQTVTVADRTITKHATTTVTAVQTVTKYEPVKTTVTETVTHAKIVKSFVTESVTEYRTKTKKVCPSTASPTVSVMAQQKKARAFGEQPLYAQEFA